MTKENKITKKQTVLCCVGIIIIIAIIAVAGTLLGGTSGDGAASFQIPDNFEKIDGENYTSESCTYKYATGNYLFSIKKISNISKGLTDWYGEGYNLTPITGLTNVYNPSYDGSSISSQNYVEIIKVDDQLYLVEVSGTWNGEDNILSVTSTLQDAIESFNSKNNVTPIPIN